MPEPQKATVKQLAYKIKGIGESPTPRFAFFLGAGASVQSGIAMASGMISDFKARIIEEQCPESKRTDDEKTQWLKEWLADRMKRPPKDPKDPPESEYSILFEAFEPKQMGRQRYIEHMIEGKKPSFGYVVLANLMAQNYINTIITTNFDDLVYSACTTFTDKRPVVYAHGLMVSDLRVTNPRPKILKLHGDFLYSALKNVASETARQDLNMARHVPVLLNEYGLVVIGYSGGDQSVTDVLKQLPQMNDLYWCVRMGDKLNPAVEDLLVEKGGYKVEIDGFDQMMDQIREVVAFDVRRMLDSVSIRQDEMIAQLKSSRTGVIGFALVLGEIADALEDEAKQQQTKSEKHRGLQFYAQGLLAYFESRFSDAEKAYHRAIELDSGDSSPYMGLATVYIAQGQYAAAKDELDRASRVASDADLAILNYNRAYLADLEGRHADAVSAWLETLKRMPNNSNAHNGLGFAYLNLKEFEKASIELSRALDLDPTNYYAAFNLGMVRAFQGRTGDAVAMWRKSLDLWQERDLIDKYNRALLWVFTGKTKEGIAEIRGIVSQHRSEVGTASLALRGAEQAASVPNPPEGIDQVVKALREQIEIDTNGPTS